MLGSRIFIGLKKSDAGFAYLEKELSEYNVHYVLWPDKRSPVDTNKDYFPQDLGRPGDVYFHYSGYVKISADVIATLENRCFNLHPAPPWYRGSAGLNLALLNGDAEYYLTVHHISPDIDDGVIIGVMPFDIDTNANIRVNTNRLTALRLKLFCHLVKLYNSEECFTASPLLEHWDDGWTGTLNKMSDFDALMSIKFDDIGSSFFSKIVKAGVSAEFPLRIQSTFGTYLLYEEK